MTVQGGESRFSLPFAAGGRAPLPLSLQAGGGPHPRSNGIRFGGRCQSRRAGKQIHDANVVATMPAHGESRLLTFNAADFRRSADYIELVSG